MACAILISKSLLCANVHHHHFNLRFPWLIMFDRHALDLGLYSLKGQNPSVLVASIIAMRDACYPTFPAIQVNKNRKPDDPMGYVDWLYLDNNIRITRGSKGSLFIHTKEE